MSLCLLRAERVLQSMALLSASIDGRNASDRCDPVHQHKMQAPPLA